MDGTLSQDSAGDIFATWLDNATGVDLAYSSDGGATWSKPKILFSNAGNPSAITLAVQCRRLLWSGLGRLRRRQTGVRPAVQQKLISQAEHFR